VLSTGQCIICLPSSSLIIYNERMMYDSNRRLSSSESSKLAGLTSSNGNSSLSSVSLSTTLDTMIALKWNTHDGVVRCRALKQTKTWYNFLVPTNDQDKTTCCTSIDSRLLFMGKTSGLIEIYRIQPHKVASPRLELIKQYLPFIAHRSPITCLHVNRQFSLLISASADGMLILWDTNRYVTLIIDKN
jgi:WD40 repeat protein